MMRNCRFVLRSLPFRESSLYEHDASASDSSLSRTASWRVAMLVPDFAIIFLVTILCFQKIASGGEPLDNYQSVLALKTQPGWTATVVAHEPQVVDPVAIRFDRQQRLWVVEMSDYPTGPQSGQAPSGRIRVLEDRDHDGQYETATTFADGLLFPTGVQPWRDGAIVTLAGKIVWMQDQDANGVVDKIEVWFEGFAIDNEQLRANHPVLGPDGLVYVAGGLRGGKIKATDPRFDSHDEVDLRDHDFCFDPDGGRWQAVVGNSQFGMSIDDFGRRIGCSNRNPAFTSVVDDDAVSRDLLLTPRDAMQDIALAGEASQVNPLTAAWTTSNLHAGQFSAACGVAAPGWFGDGNDSGEWLLVCEPTGYLVQRQWLHNQNGAWKSTRDSRPEEFLSSSDSWFRPVDIVAGPDNAVYVVDMVRAVIEHPHWAPEELKNRPDTWDGNDRGRIWKLSATRPQSPEPIGTPTVQWLGHPNPWVREVAAQFFFETEPASVGDDLKAVIAESSGSPTAVARAVQCLLAKQQLNSTALQHLLQHNDKRVIALGVKLMSVGDLTDDLLIRLSNDDDASVRFSIAAKLSAQADPTAEARQALLNIAKRDQAQPTAALEKILGSVDASQLPDLCRASVNESISTDLLSHWWTRWTVENQPEALLEIYAASVGSNSKSADKAAQRTITLFDNWLRGNQLVGEKRYGQQKIKDTLGSDRVAYLTAVSEQVSLNAMLPADIRSAAIRGAAALGDLPDSFWMLLNDDQVNEVRTTALKVLFNQDAIKTCDWMSAELLTLSPSLRASAIELLVSKPAATQWLLDEIAAGTISATVIPPQIGQRLMQSKDAKIAEQAKTWLSISSDRAALIARYQSVPSFADGLKRADVQQGKRVFAQACATCHRIDGVGVNVGPDISDTRDKSADSILTSVLHPNAAIDAAFLQYSALTTDGRVVDGLLIDDRNEGVTIRRPGGENVFVPRDELERLQTSGSSLMPDGFERLINEVDMANLVAYLKNWRYAAKPTMVDLHSELEKLRQEFKLPALAGAIITMDGVKEQAAVGVRKMGTDISVTDNDLWHLGSCTKAMTATMIATLVQDGKLQWDTTFADVFPDDAERMDAKFRDITLLQLLTHRSGLPANGPWRELGDERTPTQQRRELLRRLTGNPLLHDPGSAFLYSNVGFALAGLMAETVTGQSWEELMQQRIFKPLEMAHAGFGVPGTLGQVDQPWAHRATWLGLGPLDALQLDNAASLGPAGIVHAPLSDWGKFIALHLNRDNPIVPAEIWQRLHTPPEGTDYALGWIVAERPWAGGKALTHTGSNTVNFCVCWLAPERGFAVIAATNSGQPNAGMALDRVASFLIRRQLEK